MPFPPISSWVMFVQKLIMRFRRGEKKKTGTENSVFQASRRALSPLPPPHIFLLGENTFGHPKGYLLKKTHTACTTPEATQAAANSPGTKFFIPPKNTRQRMLGWGRGGKKQTEKHPHHKTDDWRVLCCSNTI